MPKNHPTLHGSSFIKDESTGKAYLGNWPGTTMTLLEDNMWTISFSTTGWRCMVGERLLLGNSL